MDSTSPPPGATLRRKLVITCGILLVVAGLSLAAGLSGTKTTQSDKAKQAIPAQLPADAPVPEWTSQDEPLDPRILKILMTTDCLQRAYHRADLPSPIYLTIVYSARNRKGVHPPKVCLQGAGELALKETPIELPGLGPDGTNLEALEMITARGVSETYHLYFYKCGGMYTSSFVKQQLTIWLNGLTSRNASGALIRLSMPVTQGNVETARTSVRELLTLLMPYINERL